MDKRDRRDDVPVILRLERRSQRQSDLSSAEVMRILRKRAAKTAKARSSGNLLPPGRETGND